MKKNIIWIGSCIIVGLLMGQIMFDQYDQVQSKKVSANVNEKVYFFQVGVYSSLENMKNASLKYDSYIYIEQDSKFYVFVGLTKNEENKDKLKSYFESLGYDIYIKEMELNQASFLETLDQYDLLLKETKTNQEIKEVNKSILAKYEELVVNGQN